MYYYLFQFNYYSLKKRYLYNNYSDKNQNTSTSAKCLIKIILIIKTDIIKGF